MSVSHQSCPEARRLVKAGLGARVLTPSDDEYITRQDSYWSNSAKISPACIFRPRSTDEVSLAIKALVAAGQKFAVRSGGHTNWAGAANINNGVTIDLGLLNHIQYDEATELVDLGPGLTWADVYAALQKYGRVVAGGREGNVGVAGLILGGGYTFFTARQGFACDNVVSCEVVLANGDIVVADERTNTDLFRVLKGGSNNFGIVTNFRMKTIKCDKVWGGMSILPKETTSQALGFLSEFTDNIHNDVDSNIICIVAYLPDFKDTVVATFCLQVAAVQDAPAYAKFRELPRIVTTEKETTILDAVRDHVLPPQYYGAWFTSSLKNDARITKKASELHDELVREMKEFIPEGDFLTQCVFQPLPTLVGQRSVESGGNIMGVECQTNNGFLLLATAMVTTAEQEVFARQKVQKLVQDLERFAATIEGGNLEWKYLNYADPSQDPLGNYGSRNVKKMRAAAEKYDPQGVFQKLCPGGFKISKVDRFSVSL